MNEPVRSPSRIWVWYVCSLLLLATTINYMDRQTLSNAAPRVTLNPRVLLADADNHFDVFRVTRVGSGTASLRHHGNQLAWAYPVGATVVTVLNLQILKGFSLWLNELRNAGVVILGYGLWQRDFGGANAVGQTLTLSGTQARIDRDLKTIIAKAMTTIGWIVPLRISRARREKTGVEVAGSVATFYLWVREIGRAHV